MNLMSVSLRYFVRKLYVLDQNFEKIASFITLPQSSSIWIIPDTYDLENYGQGHKAALSIQMN